MEQRVSTRLFEHQDEPAILHLLEHSDLPVSDLWLEKLKHFLVAQDERGTIVGAVGLEPYHEVGLLRSLVVEPRWRGNNIGRDLTSALEAYSRDLGLKKLYLLTTTAERFFVKQGYEVIERTNLPDSITSTLEFRSICPVSAVCLTKDI
jgi:amino-acid N-acetyltransferase